MKKEQEKTEETNPDQDLIDIESQKLVEENPNIWEFAKQNSLKMFGREQF